MLEPVDDDARILNCIPSRDTESDWVFDDAAAAGLWALPPAIPESRDLREPWWTVPDQGRTGSCVGWATADSVLRWHFVKAGRLGEEELLSPRFLWMASKETDRFERRPTTFIEGSGTSLKAALDIARRFGAVRDSVLPFGSGKLYSGKSTTFYALAAQFKIAGYFKLGKDPGKWRQWLALNGPILTRVEVDATWRAATSTHGRLDTYRADTVGGGHAVALVGYTADRFIIRNSWGERWGDDGFAYAADAYAQAGLSEAYGVSIS